MRHGSNESNMMNSRSWIIELRGAPGTIYDGELFKLQFEFNDAYPFKPPKVQLLNQIDLNRASLLHTQNTVLQL